MNIKIKNADFSATGISTVPQVYNAVKLSGTSAAYLGTDFTNGQIVHFRLVIDDCKTYGGTEVPFGWAVGPSGTPAQVGSWMSSAPQFSIVLSDGATYEGNMTIEKLSETLNAVKIATYNVIYRTIEWHIEYYVIG